MTRQSSSPAETFARFMLRVIGTASLSALFFVVAPESVMVRLHADLGLGKLPTVPIVGYLARSLSAFYALAGALMWGLSFDLRRYRALVLGLAGAFLFLGGALLAIDWAEGLPLWWILWEGPVVILFGVVLLATALRIPPGFTSTSSRLSGDGQPRPRSRP